MAATLTINSNQSLNFTVGVFSSQAVSYSYTGSSNLIWSAVGLPLGLSINSATGQIYGTPTVVGGRSAYVTVTDSTLNSYSVVKVIVSASTTSSGTTPSFSVSPPAGYANITNFQFTATLPQSGNISTGFVVDPYVITGYNFDRALEISSNSKNLYIGNYDAYQITVFNTSTKQITNTIATSVSGCRSLVMTSDDSILYAGYSQRISIFSTSSNTLVNSIYSGLTGLRYITLSPDNNFLYAANGSASAISVFSTTTNNLVNTVTVGNSPYCVKILPNNTYFYTADFISNTVSVINATNYATVSTVSVGLNPRSLVALPNSSKVYVANYSSNTISVIETTYNSVIKTINLASAGSVHPYSVDVSPDGKYVYVANAKTSDVSIISTDSDSVIKTISLGDINALNPHFIIASPDNNKIYVSNYGNGTINIIDKISTDYNTYSYYEWFFGDGGTSQALNPSYTYKIPGNYTVTFQAYGQNNNSTATNKVNVSLLLNESIYFNYVPPPAFAGHLNRYPFVINFTSSTSGNHVIDLAAQYSRSYQSQNPTNKWSFLRPEWRFLDLNGNPITSIVPTETPIYVDQFGATTPNPTGFMVGVTGTASFYFVDDIYNFDLSDISKQPYTTLIATLRTSAINASDNINKNLPSYSNSLATVSCPYKVLLKTPDNIVIKENGVRDYISPLWPTATQQLVVNTNYTIPYPDPLPDGNGCSYFWNPNSYNFCHFLPISNSTPIQLNLTSVGFSANFQPASPQFVWIDGTGYKTPGYYKGTFTTNVSSAYNVYLSANLTYTVPALYTQYITPYFWVSNPEAGMMSTVYYNYNTGLSAVYDTPNLNIAQVYNFNMPVITQPDFTNNPMALSGFHGINSIAALPFPTYHAWALDSELNYLYRINTLGQILCAVDINAVVRNNNLGFLVSNQVSPVGLTLDSQKNMWVTLNDTVSALKFDSNGNFLFATNPLSITGNPFGYPPNIDPIWYDQNTYYQYSANTATTNTLNNIDLNFIEPTGIDTDTSDNVWVTYSNFASGWLIKYNSAGKPTFSYMYPVCSCPQSIVIDSNNNIWIALSNDIYNSKQCTLERRDANGVLLSAFGPIPGLNKLTLDANNNPWFTFSYSWVGSVNYKTGTVFTLNLSGTGDTTNPADWFNPNLNTDETALEGIGCDYMNRIYVINSLENQIYVLNAGTNKLLNNFYINPQGFTYYMDDQFSPTKMVASIWQKSAQASGDWTGYNWFRKYGNANTIPLYTTTSTSYTITGVSVPFNFVNFVQNDIFKINENFDLADNMKQLAFSPALNENSNFLFDAFLGSIYGKYPFEHTDVGVTLYEKIANYVSNTADVDFCNIKELYNLAENVDINLQDFKLDYPEEIQRILNFSSINISRLLGASSVEQSSFTKPNSQGKYNMNKNPITSLNYMVTAGIPLVLKDRSILNYRLINTGYISCSSVYTLGTLANYIGLKDPNWTSYYEFHEFIPSYDGTQVAGIIDWNNPQTTINKNLSTLNAWYGAGNYLDVQFSYELYKGLGLI